MDNYGNRDAMDNPFDVGDRVATLGYIGTVRFTGKTELGPGTWIGIECDREIPSGNDGTVKFKRYFKCPEGAGLFAKPNMVAMHKDEQHKLPSMRAIAIIKKFVKNFRARKKAEKVLSAPQELQGVDNWAMNVPEDETVSVERLGKYLTECFKDEGHKARAIYRWVTDNISYAVADYLAMRYPDVSAEGTLKNRCSVCAGYANLFKALSEAAGLKAVYISGFSKGHQFNKDLPLEQQLRHAWNAFKANGHWYLLEITWAAGFMDMERQMFVRQHSDFYWLTSPGNYVDGHYPENTSWQLLAHPVTEEEFCQRVFPTTKFYELDMKLVDMYEDIKDGVDGDASVRLMPPDNVSLCTKLLRDDRQMATSYTFINWKNKIATVSVKSHDPGDYMLKIYGKDMRDKASKYDLVVTYCVKSSRASDVPTYPFFWNAWGMPGNVLYSPMNGLLCIGKTYDFRLTVTKANAVMMVMGKTKITLDKEDDGVSFFKDNVEIQQCNEVKIAGVYEKGAKGLLKFEVEDKKTLKLMKKSHKAGVKG